MIEFRLFRHLNFLAANISHLAGMVELGLGFLLPFYLLLVVGVPRRGGNRADPGHDPDHHRRAARRARFDRGGRGPLVVGFLVLAASGVALAIGRAPDGHGPDPRPRPAGHRARRRPHRQRPDRSQRGARRQAGPGGRDDQHGRAARRGVRHRRADRDRAQHYFDKPHAGLADKGHPPDWGPEPKTTPTSSSTPSRWGSRRPRRGRRHRVIETGLEEGDHRPRPRLSARLLRQLRDRPRRRSWSCRARPEDRPNRRGPDPRAPLALGMGSAGAHPRDHPHARPGRAWGRGRLTRLEPVPHLGHLRPQLILADHAAVEQRVRSHEHRPGVDWGIGVRRSARARPRRRGARGCRAPPAAPATRRPPPCSTPMAPSRARRPASARRRRRPPPRQRPVAHPL